jgi:hypothetical protein
VGWGRMIMGGISTLWISALLASKP